MTKEQFIEVHSMISQHPVFISKGPKPQTPSELQLLVVLNRLGFHGNGVSQAKLSRFHATSVGSVNNFTRRVITAILSLRSVYLSWPNAQRRLEISHVFERDYGFPDCCGALDGTLFPFDLKPQECGEDFYTRKGTYATNAQVICDHECRITYFYTGWAGSAHDQRVLSNSRFGLNTESYFSGNQYILADSAYTPTTRIVPAFKKLPRKNLPANQTRFNTKLATARVKAERCIGMLKGRFQILKSMRQLLDGKTTMREITNMQTACVILHNILISLKAAEWESGEDRDRNDEEVEAAVGRNNRVIPQTELEKGKKRREDLMAYLEQLN
eukprot:jgi/Hompol1/3633/HPOL_006657-RA